MASESKAELDRRLIFLLHRAARAAIGHANAHLMAHVGVSVAQLGTLSYVAAHPGCALTDVAKILDVNRSAVTTMVARLTRGGLLRREPNPKDGRGSLLSTTKKAERIRAEARPVFRGVLAELTHGFTSAEQEVVLRFLNAVVERFGSEAGSAEEG